MDAAVPDRRDIATRFQPGTNHQDGTVHRRGPDRRPRRLLRNMLLAALAAEGPVTVEVKGPKGGIRKKTLWRGQAATHQLLVAIQQIARQAERNPNAVLRLIELLAEQVDGRPMAPQEGGGVQRVTQFIYEGQEDAPSSGAPGSVAEVGRGAAPAAPDDEAFERVVP